MRFATLAGLINCVVVYKIDRLSRNLLDFAKIVELFDKHSVSENPHKDSNVLLKDIIRCDCDCVMTPTCAVDNSGIKILLNHEGAHELIKEVAA